MQREFAARWSADQSVRTDANLARICPPSARAGGVFDEGCALRTALYIDQDNTARAREVLAAGRWPGWTGSAARGLWLAVQHSRTETGAYDTPFMMASLPALRQAVTEGSLDAQDYARTADRALLDAGERQKYATIRLCRGAVFDMSTTYPAEVVEANRRDLGMEITFALAQPYMDGLCRRDSEGPAK